MRVRLVIDEDVDPDLIKGLQRRVHDVDIVSLVDVHLLGRSDAAVLEWAAGAGRILVSHDFRTLPGFANERLRAGLAMPGVFLLRSTLPIRVMIEELVLVVEASEAEEWVNRVVRLPLD